MCRVNACEHAYDADERATHSDYPPQRLVPENDVMHNRR
ncbi:hypothetical protein LMG27177_01908 [Paraburkholderia fynbosensis]|uniref:Uncharacterized protein n=1 Tax=Paraburkholderia fynbosensis TaxID=1200993 RepID=A0A6J5FX29_9BURK|nr:hypothetical protein LMG27177_01908 [Paraburkholderia fynbosensis]